MRILLIIAIVIICLNILGFSTRGGMNAMSMVVAIVAIAVFGGVLREFVKTKKDVSSDVRGELETMKQHIAQIEADIADIKEQIADFIIKQV